MAHIPLARKYRPKSFEELVGQPHVTTTLMRSIESKRLGQAYLFSGSRGVGKTSAARLLAKALNCERGPTPSPCNACASCAQITGGNSLDVIEIDGASNRGIDEIRSLRETVGFAPTSGGFRVYIIDEVHMLTTEAFNALLKTLEEPPAHVKFLFATTAPNKVPATILSRCQRFDFRRLDPKTIVATLKPIAKAERITLDESALFAIARAAEGSLRDAEVLLEQLASFVKGAIAEDDVTALLGAMESPTRFGWVQAILERDVPQTLAILAKQLECGREPARLLDGLVHHLRNLLILASTDATGAEKGPAAQLIDEPAERMVQLAAQAALASPQELLLMLQMLASAYELIRRSPLSQTILELILIKLATREQWQSLDEISRRLERLNAEPTLPAPPATARQPAPAEPVARLVEDAPPTAAASTADSSAAALPADVETAWPKFLERLSAERMSLAAYLFDARPLALAGNTLTVGLPGFALHQEVLSVLENRRLIERLLSEAMGRQMAVAYATLPEGAPQVPASASGAAAPPSSSPLVQEIVKLFNATVLDPPPQATGHA